MTDTVDVPLAPGPSERARLLFEQHAYEIARAAADHLKIHYPAALKTVGVSAERSLRNAIRAQIRSRFGPILSVMTELERTWDE